MSSIPARAPGHAVHAAPEDLASAAADPGTCYHCGLPTAPGAPWRDTFAGSVRAFCCAGCLGIAQTIHAAGLAAFYARRAAAGAVAPEAAADVWEHWDDPAAQAGVVRPCGTGQAEVSLLLEGMHCSACTWLVETWLARESGVTSVSVNYATRRARVVWDPARRRLSELLRAVLAIGYRAYPYDPARRESLARRESRTLLLRMAVALLAMMQVMMFSVPGYVSAEGVEPMHQRLLDWASLTLTLPAILYGAWPFFRGAWRDLRLRRLGMDVPIALGLGAAFGASAWSTIVGAGTVYYDSVTMFIALLLVARYVELVARRRAGDAVESVARVRPAVAERLAGWPVDRSLTTVSAASLQTGDTVMVRAGGAVPADGTVLEGSAHVEEAMLTGESRPAPKAVGSPVLAGSIARDGALVVRVEAAGDATRLAAVLRLVASAAGARPRIARLADRVAGHFVLGLLVIAAAAGAAWLFVDPSRAFTVVFAVLAVSCPCALSLATPAALAAATGALSRRQVVITRPDALETLARVTHVVFDKTGTLTTGRIAVVGAYPRGDCGMAEALALAAALEDASEHPLAHAFREAAPGEGRPRVEALRTAPGEGVEGRLDGQRVRLGRIPYVAALTGTAPSVPADADPAATIVALGHESRGVLAVFALGDSLRAGAREVVGQLAARGVRTLLLSGDRAAAVEAVRAGLGIDAMVADALPGAKRATIAALQAGGGVVAMVGDGINDAPSLAQAQVSLSLGSATPLAQWTADVVVLSSRLDAIGDALAMARRAMRIVRENLAWACAYNLVAVPAAALGYVTPLVAALGMSASSIAVVLNAMRAARPVSSPSTADASGAGGNPRCSGPERGAAAMEILILLIPLAVVLALLVGGAFWWSVKSGQFDDLEGPAHRILVDDDSPERSAGSDST